MKQSSKGLSSSASETFYGIVFILPSFLGFAVFVLFPVLFSFYLSFNKWTFLEGFGAIKFNGLKNFVDIFKDVWFVDSLKNTLIFAITTVPIGVALALVCAVIIHRYTRFKSAITVSVFIPYIASIVASAVIWRVVLHPSYGPVNQFLMSLGIEEPPKWFADIHWALPTVIIFSIWQQLGYMIVVYLAGIKGVPSELYESASIDGANEINKFFNITIPMVSPTTFFLVIMGIINSFKAFDQISILTQGGPGTATSVIAYYIYRTAFEFYNMGFASSAAWIMFVMIFIVTLIQWRYQKRWVNYD